MGFCAVWIIQAINVTCPFNKHPSFISYSFYIHSVANIIVTGANYITCFFWFNQ